MTQERDAYVTIRTEDHMELIENALFLEALRAAGVDNWDGYSYARGIYREVTGSLGELN